MSGAPIEDTAAAGGTEPASLGSRARRALGWSFLNQFVSRLGSVLVGIVLARLLSPDDYGVYAVALVVLNILLSMNELGVSLAIVRWPGDVRPVAGTVATLSTGFSLLLFAIAFAAAPALCTLLGAPEATGALRVLAFAVVLDALTSVPAGFLTREFLQGRRLAADTVGLVVSSAVSIVLALQGAGAWSLAWGQVVGNLVNGLLIWLWSPVGLRFGYDREHAARLLRFGLPLAGASLVVFAMLNLDYIVVGATLGPTALGLYLLAFNISGWPVNLLSAPVRRVSFAAFSRLDETPGAASPAFVQAFGLLLLGTLPACVGIAVLADPLVGMLYGEQWTRSAPVLPMLMVLGLGRVLTELAYDFLVAIGHNRPNLLLQLGWLVALLVALPVGAAAGGIVGVAVAHAVVVVVVVLPVHAVVLRRSGVALGDLGRQGVRPLAGAVVGGVLAALAAAAVEGDLLRLLAGGAALAAGYLALTWPVVRPFLTRWRAGRTPA